jgi:hypothetical protein
MGGDWWIRTRLHGTQVEAMQVRNQRTVGGDAVSQNDDRWLKIDLQCSPQNGTI